MFSFWPKIFLFLVVFTGISACNKTKIRGASRGAEGVKPSFVLNTLTAATKQGPGEAELKVLAAFEFEIQCGNCGNLNLNFAPIETPTGNGFAKAAKFAHPFVDQTYVCKADLNIKFTNTNVPQKYVYGIYFCPEDRDTNERICNKEQAVERCSF